MVSKRTRRTGYVHSIPPGLRPRRRLQSPADAGRIACGGILLLVGAGMIYTVLASALDAEAICVPCPDSDVLKLLLAVISGWVGYVVIWPVAEE